jgi:hypothetical protein
MGSGKSDWRFAPNISPLVAKDVGSTPYDISHVRLLIV